METPEPSKILFFGGTGYIGKYMVKASIKQGHKTYVYARPILTQQTSPDKVELLKEFESMGVTIVQGNLDEHDKIVELLRQVDIVISTLAYPQVLDQLKIIDAIRVAGNIKRFLPSDFGVEEDIVAPLPPFQAFLDKKRRIRRVVEGAGVPYTFVAANLFGAYFVNYLLRPHEHKNEVTIYGTGEAKVVFNYEEDIAMFTIKAAIDPRTRNRIVIYRPRGNIISQLELISLWEQKTGQTFKRVHVPEEEIVKLTESMPPPKNIPPAILHSLFVKGESMSYKLEEDDIEGSRLYPDYKYTTIDELLDIFHVDPPKPAMAAFE